MRSGFRIGRIFGIEVRVDWSWLFIFALVSWNLAFVFGQLHSGWSTALRWGTALVAALLFFASVLAHELAHSLVARARGMSVRNITLFLFGGVSNIQREPPSAITEFLMAIVGPLTSVVLGIVLAVIAAFSVGSLGNAVTNPQQVMGQLGPVTTLLLWLGSVNVLVGLFNMIPGFPLDGGRVVRSILWAITDNLRQSTRWASWLGQGIAWIMILAGIAMVFGVQIPILGSGLVNGVWLAFIGWFLNSSASQSYRQVVVHDVLEDVPVERMMYRNPVSVSPGTSVESLVHDHIMKSDDYGFPVLDEGQIVGMVTMDDVRSVERDHWSTTLVRDIMTPAEELAIVSPDEEAADALELLQQRDVRQLPVMRDGKLAGILRRRDIVKYLQLQSDTELGQR
ncbi:MAG: site-2 protease family protein [Anaerolineae bacterium]